MFEITTTYSLWWLLPIVILSAILSALLYFRNSKEDFPKWLKALLFSTRFLTFVLLGSFLLSPMVKSWKTEVEKPVIVLAVDNSSSMIFSGDTSENILNNRKIVENIIDGLGSKYQVDAYIFGSGIKASNKPDFQDNYTDINQCIIDVKQKYQYRNVGVMILISDGIYNRGSNPVYSAYNIPFPIYTLGLGDSSTHADLAISRVLYNRNVFIENTFPIEVSVMAKNRKNTDVKLSLYKGKQLISTSTNKVYSDNQLIKFVFKVKAEEPGLHSYRLVVNSFESELNTINNSKTINVDVIGEKKKVILLFAAPNPDIAALKQVFETRDEFEVEEKFISDFNGNLKDYNLAIFYQFPYANRASFDLIKQAKNNGIPFVISLGTQTNISRFNSLNLGVKIETKNSSVIESTALLNPDFSDFLISKSINEQLSELPPLYVPFGRYSYSNYVHPIAYQRLGSVNTQYPLLAVSEQNGYRNAFIFGEGLWKWRLIDFQNNKQHKAFDEFIMKLIRYVSINKTYRKFDVQYQRRVNQMEPVEFYASFLNDNYEKVQDADIQLIIKNENGEEFPYAFSKSDEDYTLNAGQFPQGVYSFVAKLNYHGKYFERTGSFVVDAVDIEAVNLQANYGVLRVLASETGGDFYTQTNIESLVSDVLNKGDIVDIQRQYLQFKELIRLPWIWFLIIFLMTLEWFLRKQMGSY
jgi:hypothetical protein